MLKTCSVLWRSPSTMTVLYVANVHSLQRVCCFARFLTSTPAHKSTHRQPRSVLAFEAWGMKKEDPGEQRERQTVRKRSMRKTCSGSSCSSSTDMFCHNLSVCAWSKGGGVGAVLSSDKSLSLLFSEVSPQSCCTGPVSRTRSWVHMATLTSARFSISHLLRIFMANTLSVFFNFTTATCEKSVKTVIHLCDGRAAQRMWSMLKTQTNGKTANRFPLIIGATGKKDKNCTRNSCVADLNSSTKIQLG